MRCLEDVRHERLVVAWVAMLPESVDDVTLTAHMSDLNQLV